MIDLKSLCTLIDARKDELFELLSSLVRINSENFGPYGNEIECAEFIAKLCRELGLETDVYSPLDLENFESNPDYFPGRTLENRRNVTACWKGAADSNALMLMGHLDTVVIGDRSKWTFEPLCGDIRDGKVWGRGACDDKYALATTLFLIRLLKDMGFEPKANLVFSAYGDEERGGSHGAMAAVMRDPCDRIVNMDCKAFEIWHSASGGGEIFYDFHTEKTVDSAALTAKAIPVVMEALETFAANRKAELEANPFYQGTIIPGTSMRYMEVRAGNMGADLGDGSVLFLLYTDKTKDEIYAELDALHKVIAERLAPMGIIGDGFRPNTRFFHYQYAEPDCAAIRDMQQAAQEISGREVKVCGSCLSDLSVILKYGNKQAFSFGIGRDFAAYGGAHQPDEFIECDNLVEFAKIIGAYILKTVG